MTSRRSIAERVIAQASTRGTPIDGDAEFMAIVELWVAGEIEAAEMRDRYNALLERRSRGKHNSEISPQAPEGTAVQASAGAADEATP
ncbi:MULTISPECIES: hypothetical protein [Rhizobium]|uniref:Antitoxin VbhA domain-containing protein n=1 Tax=Rhizobium favelukesii TaxID=348824 RepID=W6RLP4_9HYPH|nr:MULTISPECIES: hypothetical protein [Rhizobium]MCS0463113.1 hypothetical protein [Rhizobium favelukesii]UFS85182.1 hypothetical protein LPB79_36475 [Rhizobium sp. T136]CDM61160.1 hypothetical protein LPU83_pLPU83c_0598 [Rhizobium favelukesii]